MGITRAGAGLSGVLSQSTVPIIDGSVYFNSEGVLYRTPQNSSNRNVWTLSWWSKLSGGPKGYQYMFSAGGGTAGNVSSSTPFIIYQIDNGAATHFFYQYNGSYQYSFDPTDEFRDCGSWYHHVIQFDSLSLTVKYWVNNREIATNGGYAYAPAALLNSAWNDGGTMQRIGDGDYGFKGQMTQWYSIDGLKLTPDDFAFTDPRTGVWRPKPYQNEISSPPVNNPNNNTTWSANVSATSGSFGSGEEATKGFDGSLTTKCKTNTNGAIINITFTNVFVEKLLRIRTNFTNGTGSTIKVNNVSYNLAPSNSDGQFVHIPGFTGAMTSIQLAPSGSVNASFSAIEVDGVILQDSTTTNNRTWDSSLLFGTNGFYLPLDGSAQVGTDMSGQGNHFASQNLSLSASPERATGAQPMRNTAACPRVARPGARGSDVSADYTVTVSNPGSGNKYYFDSVLTPTPTFYEGGTYTFDYTAATSHPLYLSSLSDGKHNSKAYSVLFDGNGDRLEIADHDDFHFGAESFTIEGWIYLASFKNCSLVGCNNSAANAGWEFDIFSDGSLRFYSGNGGTYNASSLGATSPGGVVNLNEWTHIAAVRRAIPDSGGMSILRLFVNGGHVAESTLFHTFADGSNGLDIGNDGVSTGTTYHLHGYISNLRIVKGTAIYAGTNFDPPTTSLTNVTNTVLLCCQESNATTAEVTPSSLSRASNNQMVASDNRYLHLVHDTTNNQSWAFYRRQSDYNGIYRTVSNNGTSVTFGTETVFDGQSSPLCACYEPGQDRKVVFYLDGANSSRFSAAVVDSSGTLTIGAHIVGSQIANASCCSIGNNKIFIAYEDASSYKGYGLVASLSGSTLTFGSAVEFSGGGEIVAPACCYDPDEDKVVIGYVDYDNDYPKAIVASISGTTPSYGTAIIVNGGTSVANDSHAVSYDTSSNKVLHCYGTNAGSGNKYGKAVVLTVSGTSLTAGTEVQFADGYAQATTISYDSHNNKHLVSYRNTKNSGGIAYLESRNAVISGTSVSFGEVFETTARNTYTTSTFDNTNNRVLVAYRDQSNSYYPYVDLMNTTNVFSISAVGNAAANNTNPHVYIDNGKFGLNTGTSNVTKYTLPRNSNGTLYYFCNAHSGMGGSINVISDSSKADPAAYCLHGALDLQKNAMEPNIAEIVNVNHDTNVQVEEGGFPFGNGLGSSTESALTNFYHRSLSCPGNTNDYIDFYNLPAIGMDDFTIECWYRCTDSGYNTIFEYGSHTDTSSNKGFIVSLNSSGQIWARDSSSGSVKDIENASLSNGMTPTGLNKWNHVAIQRKGVIASLFVNGNLIGHGDDNTSVWDNSYTSTRLRIGRAQYISGEGFHGNLSDVRFYKGVAKYDHELGFIPASSYPNILADSPSGLSLPSQFDSPLSGSAMLDGGDHLSLPDSADYNFGSGDWCIECFVYANTMGTVGLIDKSDSGTFSSSSFELRWNSGQVSFYYFDGNNRRFMQTGTSLISNMWTHLVAYRDGDRMKLFQDGLFCAHYNMSSVGAMNDTTNIVSIGGHGGNPGNSGHKLNGFISNVRIIKGSVPEEYRTTQQNSDQSRIFNPPTAPLTNITNTVLLTCQSTTDVTAKVVGGTITANGDPQPSTWNPFDIKDNTAMGGPGNACVIDQAHSRIGGYNPTQGSGGIVQTNYGDGIGSIPVHTGKYYFEVDILTVPSGGGQIYAGVLTGDYHDDERGWTQDEIAAVRDTGVNYGFSGLEGSSIGTYAAGDTLGFALDADNKLMYVSKNGRYAGGGPSSSSNLPSFRQMGGKEGIGFRGYVPMVSDGSNHNNVFRMNCGQMAFKYRAPEGYMAWNTSNSRSDIKRSNALCGAVTWTGNASANNSVNTGQIKFKPDLAIFKNRDAAEWPYWIDSVRGNTAMLSPYTATSQTEFSSTSALASFDEGGFTVGANGSTNGSANMVAWCWKAGGKDGSNLYNIDDVGYASASDVKMNIGGLNADFYDNSQRWSDLVTGTLDTTYGNSSKTAPFQGTTGTNYPDGIRPVSGNYLSMNFGSTFTNAKRIRIYGHASLDGYTYNGTNENLKINGVAIPKGAWQQNGGAAGQSVVTLQLPDGLSTLEWGYSSGSQSSGYLYLQAIEVDGKRLVDDNVTLPNKPTIAPSACSVNTAAGFSIVTYTGNLTAESAVPHGLGKKPAFMIVKERNANSGWTSFNQMRGPSKISYINLTQGEVTETGSTATWANREPDEHVFYVGNNGASNDNNLVAYIWAEIPGFSKFGYYVGNGNVDGPFINCGFKPAIVLYKHATNTYNWYFNDSSRSDHNSMMATLAANLNGAEDTSWGNGNIEFYSNGFKLIRTGVETNNNNDEYLYMAWAEDPLSGQFGATSNTR